MLTPPGHLVTSSPALSLSTLQACVWSQSNHSFPSTLTAKRHMCSTLELDGFTPTLNYDPFALFNQSSSIWHFQPRRTNDCATVHPWRPSQSLAKLLTCCSYSMPYWQMMKSCISRSSLFDQRIPSCMRPNPLRQQTCFQSLGLLKRAVFSQNSPFNILS